MRDRHIDQRNRTGDPETDPLKCLQVIFDKCAKAINWRKDSFFNKWCFSNWTSIRKRKKKKFDLSR